MRRSALLAGIVAAAVAAGCGDDDSTTPSAGSGTLVAFERSGGVAGMPLRLTVERQGGATVEAGVDPARERFDLGDSELEQLRSELEAAELGAFEPAVPSGCADCYAYELTYDSETISYDESQDVPEEVAAVVAHLAELAEAHYPAGADEPPIVN